MKRIIVPIEFFPIRYRKYLDKALEIIPQVSLLTEYQKSDNFLFLGLECNDHTDIFMVGSAVGYLELKEAIEEVIPEVLGKIDNHIKSITSSSDN